MTVLSQHWWDVARAAAIAANETENARIELDARDLLGMCDERDHLRASIIRTEYDITETLADALGMERDPDYGYPTGDHTAVTLAETVRDYCKRLRGEA